MSYPTPEELGDFAKQIIMEVMAPRGGSSTGSDKSGPGEWYTKDCIEDPLYHSRRVVNHALSAIGLSGDAVDANGETCSDHWHRCLVRAVFCAYMDRFPLSAPKKLDWKTYLQSGIDVKAPDIDSKDVLSRDLPIYQLEE